jgi:hypothetical protein
MAKKKTARKTTKVAKTATFGQLKEGARFTFPRTEVFRGRSPIYTKVGTRAYQPRVGDKVTTRALSAPVVVVR